MSTHYQETVVLERFQWSSMMERRYRKQLWFRAREKLLKRYLLPIYRGGFNGDENGKLTGFYFDGWTLQVYRLVYYPMYSPIIGTLRYDYKVLSRVTVVHKHWKNKPRWTDPKYFGKFSVPAPKRQYEYGYLD